MVLKDILLKGADDMPLPPEVIKRLDDMDTRLDKLEKALQEQELADVRFEEQFKSMKQEFVNLREDVLITVREHSSQTWKLINKGLKIIIILVVVIVTLAGVKLSSDLLTLF